jgi:hypothetical protein
MLTLFAWSALLSRLFEEEEEDDEDDDDELGVSVAEVSALNTDCEISLKAFNNFDAFDRDTHTILPVSIELQLQLYKYYFENEGKEDVKRGK